ncbi:MAG: trypsin-like serine protease [Proteobacteria bacterium]|nr:trypsin-like serine protease [Pseudomonadota bacterium]
MKKTVYLGILTLASSFAFACSNESHIVTQAEYTRTHGAIVNGTQVTGNDRLSTVVLTLSLKNGLVFCTGTLIMPNYVLTAGHCIADCDGSSDLLNNRKNMVIGIGQNYASPKAMYHPESFHLHPNFVCTDDDIQHDIAVIKLKESVPAEIAKPSIIVPTSLIPGSQEVDYVPGIKAVSVGFGLTNPANHNSVGVKYETERLVLAICPATIPEKSTMQCPEVVKVTNQAAEGFVYFYDKTTNVCSGDSGGPTFIERDGREYLLGVTSWVNADEAGHCLDFSAMTLIEDNRDFVSSVVEGLPAAEPEICDNGLDDNGDNRLDCADPYCSGTEICKSEICYNGLDDDGDARADCDDPDCDDYIKCLPEICDNSTDDNEDGKVDCDDPTCAASKKCQPEDCRNGVDDNEDGKADCDDPQCQPTVACVPENCTNEIDDNEDGRTDCDDPQCASSEFCVREICDNGIDDDDDFLIDCQDDQCSKALNCQPEICDNGTDDNGNGLSDCRDPDCFGVGTCPERPEICGNSDDDNGDGRIDCDDETCDCAQPRLDSLSSSGCTAAPENPASGGNLAAILLILAGMFSLRRRKN